MGVSVKIQLKTIEDRLKKLKKFDWIVLNAAKRTRKLVFQNWEKSKGADGGKFKPLTEKYKNFKSKQGRSSVRDLVLKGSMRNSLLPVKENTNFYVLTFIGSDQVDKARGNAVHAPNMMIPISDRINKKVQRLAFDLFTKQR